MRVASLEDHHGDCVIANATQANVTASNQTAAHSHDQEGSAHSHTQQEPAKKAEGGGVLPGLGLDPVRDAAAAAKEAKEAAKEAAQEAAASADETANAAHPGATVTGAAWGCLAWWLPVKVARAAGSADEMATAFPWHTGGWGCLRLARGGVCRRVGVACCGSRSRPSQVMQL